MRVQGFLPCVWQGCRNVWGHWVFFLVRIRGISGKKTWSGKDRVFFWSELGFFFGEEWVFLAGFFFGNVGFFVSFGIWGLW